MRKEFSSTIENEPEKSKNNSEKSSINKVIGVESEKERQEIEDEFARRFKEQELDDFKRLKKIEIEKTPRQIQIINFVNDETNKLLKKYGLPKFDIPADNVHLLKEKDYYKWIEKMEPEDYKKLEESGYKFIGKYCGSHQSLFVNINAEVLSAKNDPGVANALFHEFFHFKTFQSFRNLEKTITSNQVGLELKLKSGKLLFNNLNEGLTVELEKKFYHNVLKKHPLFSKRIQENEKIIKENLWNKKIESIADDITDIKVNVPISEIDGEKSKTTKIEYTAFGYLKQRKILNTLIEKLYSKNKDKFDDKEQVFDLFVKSAFTGKLNWGKLVNQTFGKGAFKKLAQLDENVEELEKFVNNLK